MLLPAFSPFPAKFSKGVSPRIVKTSGLCGKGSNVLSEGKVYIHVGLYSLNISLIPQYCQIVKGLQLQFHKPFLRAFLVLFSTLFCLYLETLKTNTNFDWLNRMVKPI